MHVGKAEPEEPPARGSFECAVRRGSYVERRSRPRALPCQLRLGPVFSARLPCAETSAVRRRSADAVNESSVHPSARTILICEDDQNLRQLIRAVIGDEYLFLEADDGAEAVELARAHRPDLIILDLMLPRLSGLEVLDRLRHELPAGETNIIVMSAWTHAENAALSAGANRFVPKPFESDELVAIVAEVLRESPA